MLPEPLWAIMGDEESLVSVFGLGSAIWDLMIQLFSKKPQEQKQFNETQRKRVSPRKATECHRLCRDPPWANPWAPSFSSVLSPSDACFGCLPRKRGTAAPIPKDTELTENTKVWKMWFSFLFTEHSFRKALCDQNGWPWRIRDGQRTRVCSADEEPDRVKRWGVSASTRMLMKQGEHGLEEKRREKGRLGSSQPSFQNGRQRSMCAKPCLLPSSPSPRTCFLPPTFYAGMETCHPKASWNHKLLTRCVKWRLLRLK